jgi:hypothetical protein
MWSFGCVLGEMESGKPLFPGDSEMVQFEMITEYLGLPPESYLEVSDFGIFVLFSRKEMFQAQIIF